MLRARSIAAGAQISSTGSIMAGSRLFRTAHNPGLGDVAELCRLGSSIPTLQIIQRPESCSEWDRNESSAAAYPANGDCHAHGRHHLRNSRFAGAVSYGRLVCLRRSYGPGRADAIRQLHSVGNRRSGCCAGWHGADGLYSIAAGAAMTSHLTFTETPDEKRRWKISDGSPRQGYRPRRNQRALRILNPCSVELLGVMNNPDQETVLRAIEDARRILGEYIEAGEGDAGRTHGRLEGGLGKKDARRAPAWQYGAWGRWGPMWRNRASGWLIFFRNKKPPV